MRLLDAAVRAGRQAHLEGVRYALTAEVRDGDLVFDAMPATAYAAYREQGESRVLLALVNPNGIVAVQTGRPVFL